MKNNLDITKPRYNEQIWSVPWPFVKSRFHCTEFKLTADLELSGDKSVLSQFIFRVTPLFGFPSKIQNLIP